MRCLLYVAAFWVGTTLAGAAFAQPTTDTSGWHTWRVAALAEGSGGCCYDWRSGESQAGACRLDRNGFEPTGWTSATASQPMSASRDLQVFVRMDSGRIVDARALSAACPVDIAVEVQDFGVLEVEESVRWLMTAWRNGQQRDEDLLSVMAQHADGDVSLIELVEDLALSQQQRKAALFWLANSGTEVAIDWFDGMLKD